MLRVSAVFFVYLLTSNLAVSDPILNQPGKVPKLKKGDVSNGRVNSSKQSLSIPVLLRGNLFPSYHTPFKTFRDKRLASNDPDADSDTDIATLPSLQLGKIATLRARIRSLGKGSIQKVIQEALDRFNAANGLHTETANEHEEGDPADDADMSHGDFISMDEGVNSPETELRDTASSPTQYKPTRTGLVSTSLSDPLEVTTPHTFSTKQNPGKDFPGNSTRGKEKQPQNRIGIASAPLQQRNLSSNMNTIIAKAQVISHVPIPPVKSSITSGMNKRLESSLGQKNPGDFRGNVQLWYARKSPNSHLQFQKKLCVSSCAKERNATLKSPLLGGLQSKLAQQERLTEARKIFTTGQGKPPVERPVKSEAFLTNSDASQNTKGKFGKAVDLNSPPKQILGVAPDQSKTKFVHFPLPVGRYRYLNTPGSMDHSSEVRTANSSIKSNPDLKSGELTNANYQWPNHLTSIPLNGLKSAYGNGHEKAKFEQHRGKEIKSIQSIQGSMVSSSLFGDSQSSANARLPSANSKETFGATQKLSLDDLLLVKMKEYLIQLAKNDSRVMLDLENDYLSQQIGPDERGSLHTQTNGQSSITLSFPGESVKKVVPIDNRKAYTDLQARLRNEKLLFVGRVSHMGVPIVGRLNGHISPMYQGHHSYKESEGVRHFNDAVNVQAVDSYRSEDPQMQEWPATSLPEPGQAENVNPVVASSVVEESRGTVNRDGDTLHQRNHAETSYADSNGYEGSLTQNQRSIATDIAGLQMSSKNTPFLSSTPLQGNTHANCASTLLANGHGVYDGDVKFISDKSENIKNAETLIRHQGTDLAQASKQEFAKLREPVGQRVQGHDVNIAAGATYPTNYGDGGRVYDGEEKAERSNNMEEAASVVRSGSAEKNDAEGNDRSIGEDKLQSNSVETQENSESPTSEERYSPNVKASLIESDDIHKETPYYKSGLQQGQENKDLPKPVTEFPRQGDGEESRFSKVSYSPTGGDSVTQQVSGEWQSRVIEHEGRGSDKDHSELQNKYVTTDSQENQVSNEEAVHVENDFPTHIPDSYLPQPQSDYIENPKEGSGGHEERDILSAPNKPTTSNEDYYSMDDLVKVEIQPSEAPVSSSVNVTAKRERRFLIPEIKANGDHVDMFDDDAKKGESTLKGSGERKLTTLEFQSDDPSINQQTSGRANRAPPSNQVSVDPI